MSIHKILQIYYKKSIRKMDNKFKQKMYKKLNANKYMKNCSSSLVAGQSQIKTIMSFYFSLTKWKIAFTQL